MIPKLMAMSLALTLAVFLPTPLHGQQGSKDEPMKQNSGQKSAESKGTDKQARLQGTVVRSSKDKSTLTIRSGSVEKIVHYDNSTRWVSQEHGSNKVNDITPDDVKDGDRLIVKGTDNGKSGFQATLISKRLTPE